MSNGACFLLALLPPPLPQLPIPPSVAQHGTNQFARSPLNPPLYERLISVRLSVAPPHESQTLQDGVHSPRGFQYPADGR